MPLTSPEYFEALSAARDFLRHVCGYECRHNDDEALRRERADEAETVLAARLEKKLRELNPVLSESGVQRAIKQLQQPSQTHLAHAQQQLHARLTGHGEENAVRYFDFDQPERNDFLVVEEFRVTEAAANHVCDLAVFVNGVPLALAAIGASNSKEGVQRGVQRLAQMPRAAPRLFHTALILLSVQKNFSAVGAANGEAAGFRAWEEPHPFTWEELRAVLRQIPQRESELPAPLDLALAGALSPRALLELMKNFILFEYGKHGLAPRLAWSHQYHAVRQTRGSLPSHGIIWHPGNSGKSCTLAWLAAQLRRAHVSHRLALVSDCEKQRALLRRIFEQQNFAAPDEIFEPHVLQTFLRGSRPATALLTHAALREALHATPEQLKTDPAPLLFLFDEKQSAVSLEELRRALPHAQVIALTSYPPLREASSEPRLHFFNNAQAERRGYLLPARFEARLPRLQQHLATSQHASSHTPSGLNARRITALAEDLHEHFTQEIHGNGCKALVLAANAQEAAWYYEALAPKMDKQAAVLLPKPEPHERELTALYRRFDDHAQLLARWRDPQNELALLILAGPLGEDLRTPELQAVYVDRELRGYDLLRALAATQTPGASSKHFGLLVDYFGVANFLKQELERFDFHQAEPVVTLRYAEGDKEELRLRRRELRAIFSAYPHEDNFEAWLFALEPAEPRRAFQRTWQGYVKALDQMLPGAQEEHTLVQEALWFDRVRQEAAAFYFDPALAEAKGSRKVRSLLEAAARTYGASRVREAVRLTAENFMEELEALSSRQAQVLRLQYALMEEMKQNLERDPAFYQALQQRVTKITVERRQKQIDDETALQRLREEALRLRRGSLAAGAETQLAEEAQAYWRVLARYLAPAESEHKRYEELATRLLAALEPDTRMVDWTLKEDWQREMRRKIKHLLREVNCPADLLDPLTHAVMQLTRARYGPAP